VNPETRYCPRCDKERPASEFYAAGAHKPCQILYELHRRKVNRKKFRSYRLDYQRRLRKARKNRGQEMLPL
jgi:hypothetical protein